MVRPLAHFFAQNLPQLMLFTGFSCLFMASACGSKKGFFSKGVMGSSQPNSTLLESSKSEEIDRKFQNQANVVQGSAFSAEFVSPAEDVIQTAGAPEGIVKVELTFSAPADAAQGSWSLFASENRSGFVDSQLIAEKLPLSQTAFDWNVSEVPPGSYQLTALVEFQDQSRVYQPQGMLHVKDGEANNSPFVKILAPNNTFRLDNGEVELIERNRDRNRHSLGEPLRIVYSYVDFEGDGVTLSLLASIDEQEWIPLVEGVPAELDGGGDTPTGVLTWTPPADFDKNMYSLKLVATDGQAEGFSIQRNIGIGNVTWDAEVRELFIQNCAMAGCHDSNTSANRRDYTSYDDRTAGNREIRGAASHRDFDTQLVNYWLRPVGTRERDRRAMPQGRGPLPPAVLGKFLIWDMNQAEWRENQREYRGDRGGRKLRQ